MSENVRSERIPINTENFCGCGDTRWLKEKKWVGGFIKTFAGYCYICAHCGDEWKPI